MRITAWDVLDVVCLVFGVYLILHRPVQGRVLVVTKFGTSVLSSFDVEPDALVVSVHGSQGPEYRDNCGFVWSVRFGACSNYWVTNSLRLSGW